MTCNLQQSAEIIHLDKISLISMGIHPWNHPTDEERKYYQCLLVIYTSPSSPVVLHSLRGNQLSDFKYHRFFCFELTCLATFEQYYVCEVHPCFSV